MIFGLENLLGIILITLVLLISSFALFLPLALFLKNYEGALKSTIPVSISFQIIFAYIFYCFGLVWLYPIVYGSLILVLNIFAFLKLRIKITKIKFPKMAQAMVGFIIVAILIYSRFYDAFKFIAPGTIDTYNHLMFLKELKTLGYLSNTYYAPGFHLLLYPLTYIAKYSDIYRFTGSVIGMILVLNLYLLFRNTFKNKISIVFFLIILVLPIFNQLTLSTIGFYSTSISFVIFLGFIYLLSTPKELTLKSNFIFYLILTLALSFTVPYLFVQYLPALAFLTIIVLLVKKNILVRSKKIFLLYFLISIFGLMAAFGHVYLQTKILHTGNSFPEIPTVSIETNSISTNLVSENELFDFKTNNWFVEKYINPMISTAKDVLSIKNVRFPNNPLSAGAYLWFLISLILIYIAIKRNNKYLFIVSAMSIIFGVSILTGVLEMTFYRGRSGWYLLLLSVIGITCVFDEFYSKKYLKIWGVLFLAGAVYALTSPPQFYRAYYPEVFTEVKKISNDHRTQKLVFVSDYQQLAVVSEEISSLPLNEESLQAASDEKFLILEKKFFLADPVLSQQALSTDKNLKLFNQKQTKAEAQFNSQKQAIVSSGKFSSYEKYFEDENILIFHEKE